MAEGGESYQVYVGGISWSATENDLSKLFSEVGEVVSVKVRISSGTGVVCIAGLIGEFV